MSLEQTIRTKEIEHPIPVIRIIEDSDNYYESLHDLFESEGIKLVRIAKNYKEACEAISKIDESEIGIILVDGNLHKGVDSNQDGANIVTIIKTHAPLIITIGHSGGGQVPGAHHQCAKREGPEVLLSTIQKIFLDMESAKK